MKEAGERLSAAAGALRAAVHLYGVMGTPLYATLAARGANDAEIVALVSRGREGAAPMHLFSSVHYLLLRDPSDPLSRFFATLTPSPQPPEDAFPEFVRFCREHREEILKLLQKLAWKILELFDIGVHVVRLGYRDKSVVARPFLTVDLFSFDDAYEPRPNSTAWECRFVHQQQNIDRVSVRRYRSRKKPKVRSLNRSFVRPSSSIRRSKSGQPRARSTI